MVTFRRQTLLPLDECLSALHATLPPLTRAALHRWLKRHAISRLPASAGDKPQQKTFKSYPLGYFHSDMAEVRTEDGQLALVVASDRPSQFA